MVSALHIGHRAHVNGYSGASAATENYWPSSKKHHYPAFLTFANEVSHRKVQKKSRPPIQPLNENTDDTLRDLAVVNDGFEEISYPIAPIDTCDCVGFPEAEFTLTDCSTDVYWGTFQIQFTDGECYDVSYADESMVYANCPSGADPDHDAETEYVLCVVDLHDDGSGDSSTTESSSGSEEESTTLTKSLRQETTGAAKTTHIHLTVHRLATFALEAVLALQSTWP